MLARSAHLVEVEKAGHQLGPHTRRIALHQRDRRLHGYPAVRPRADRASHAFLRFHLQPRSPSVMSVAPTVRAVVEHESILEALEARDAKRLAAIMRTHLGSTWAKVSEIDGPAPDSTTAAWSPRLPVDSSPKPGIVESALSGLGGNPQSGMGALHDAPTTDNGTNRRSKANSADRVPRVTRLLRPAAASRSGTRDYTPIAERLRPSRRCSDDNTLAVMKRWAARSAPDGARAPRPSPAAAPHALPTPHPALGTRAAPCYRPERQAERDDAPAPARRTRP